LLTISLIVDRSYNHIIQTLRAVYQRWAGAGVQESTPAGVGAFQQNQEWIFSIGTGGGAGIGVIFNHSVDEIILSICTLRNL